MSKKEELALDETLALLTVNEKKAYHNCEMIFSCYYEHDTSDFKVTKKQKYKIHTSIKEVEALNEALNVYQEAGFKDTYLLFSQEIDGSKKYPDFVQVFKHSQELARKLASVSNDEDSLDQLQEYCTEQAPSYADDFGINKQIESLTLENYTREIDSYEDLKSYLRELKKTTTHLFL